MTCFPDTFRFRYAWRPYQQRVLDAFDSHLDDRHFHVSAAPGAGKTVLGLEAMRRLQRPALILAPTIAIRDQWRQRLCESFLPDDADPVESWVSEDLETPGKITLSTYQGVHAAAKRVGMKQLNARLKAAGLTTLVLDEAHHLRQQWWECLIELKSALDSPWIIALTATPPFDVAQQEWNRYIRLCGPLDAEVSVPELVKAGNLCPHQDCIYFTAPAEEEAQALYMFEAEARSLMHDLVLQAELPALLARLPIVVAPDQHIDELAKDGDLALSVALYLQETAAEHARALLRTLGLDALTLPRFSIDWAEILLNGLLFDRMPQVDSNGAYVAGLTRRLRSFGAIEHRRVYLRAPPRLLRLLESSRSKCVGAADIIERESRADPVGLRAAILCDHIREQDLPVPGDLQSMALREFAHIGVVPVFEQIRRLALPEVRLGVLTGSLVIVPEAALPQLQAICSEFGDATHSSEPLWHAPQLHTVSAASSQGGVLLAAVTRLFEQGEINVLIGTAALLGEGWDAPALSTLILASSVRASMRSNQMRGRAIRVQRGNPDKAANIWHLACLPQVREDDIGAPAGGADMAALSARFRSFSGVAVTADASGQWPIETGIDRLRLDATALRTSDAAALNAQTGARAMDRALMREHWQKALHNDDARTQRMLTETRMPIRRLATSIRFRHGLQFEQFWWVRWIRARILRREFGRLCDGLFDALKQQALINSSRACTEIVLGELHLRCRLLSASTQEESLFAQCLQELFADPVNPRYLLQQRNRWLPVPDVFDSRKEQAEVLRAALAKRVGNTQLVYTRGADGKRALLTAREQWLAARFDQGYESRMIWG